MAQIPVPPSWNSTVGAMVGGFLSRYGLKRLKVGSPILSMIETAAQSDLRGSQDTFNLLNAQSLDRAKKTALDRIGADENVPRLSATNSSGAVDIADTSFLKISTKIYQGRPAPIVGSNQVNVLSASSFPGTGSIYLGRSTTNYEGPLAYTAAVNNGTYWTLTLSGTTRRFHNTGESVILAQGGDRSISAGTVVQTPQGNANTAVTFSTLFAATIPDGETGINGVLIISQVPGVGSNVPAEAISAFTVNPFSGATVINPLPLTNAEGNEDDDSYRERIKAARQSRVKGTALAITTSVQGITATDENKTVTSSALVAHKGVPTTLYIDDGTGYEETSQGVALETLMDLASGGEQFFQVTYRPVARAQSQTINTAPFQLISGSALAVIVGGIAYEHIFTSEDFQAIGNATAYEVVASINANPLLGFSAATINSGTGVRIFAKTETGDDLDVTTPGQGLDANAVLLFPSGRVDTLRLYKNDRLLSKDGDLAIVRSLAPSFWGSLASGVTLILAVDGTAAVTYTFVDQDFVNANTGFTSVGKNSVSAWVAVINAKIPGVTAAETNGLLELSSNSGTSARAQLAISGGTLVTPGNVFTAQTATGKNSDYTLDRNTGQIRLGTALTSGDSLLAGTLNSRAFLQSDLISPTTVTGTARLWFSADGNATAVSTGLNSASTLTIAVQAQKAWGSRVRVTAGASVFTNVLPGDWMVAWDPNISTHMRGTWRVAQASGTWVEVERRDMLTGRWDHQLVTLADGRVMAIGGRSNNGVVLATCEIYDPSTNAWTATGAMASGRCQFSATRFSTGKVLVAGGLNDNGPQTTNALIDASVLATCEIWDPGTGLWSPAASLPVGAQRRLAFSGLVTSPAELFILAGGIYSLSAVQTVRATAYKYDWTSDTWTALTSMNTARYEGASVILTTAKLFAAAGGTTPGTASTVCEIYDAGANTWTTTTALASARRGRGIACLLADNRVLLAGGYDNSSVAVNSSAIFDPAGPSWTNTTGTLNSTRAAHSLNLQGNNQVLASMGAGTGSTSAETFNVGTGLWTTTAATSSAEGRQLHKAITLGSGNVLVAGGQETTSGPGGLAGSEIYDYTGNSWAVVDQLLTQTSFSLAANGLTFVRTQAPLQEVDISGGSSFTAANFVTSINSQLLGASASTYRTNSLRVNTNTYEINGDISLVAFNTAGAGLQIDQTPTAIKNLDTHLASVLSGNSQAGTPEFRISDVIAGEALNRIVTYSLANEARANSIIVGLKSFDDLYNSASPVYRQGNNKGFISALTDVSSYLRTQSLDLRLNGREWNFRDRYYVAAPLAIGPQDSITTVVDQDTDTKRFTIPLYRKLKPVGGTYASQNTYKDADNSGQSLAIAFGLGYDFNDFALYMQSRVLTNVSSPTKTILWRYNSHGPDGDTARMKYTYPQAPALGLSVVTSITASKYTDISVVLPSGPLKTGYGLRNTTNMGTAAASGPGGLTILSYVLGYSISSATRDGGGNVTLTLTLPSIGGGALADITNHGFTGGESLYVNSSSGTFPSGVKVLTSVTATTVVYSEAGTATTVANIGTVSFDASGEANYTGATPSAIVLGDILTVTSAVTLPSAYKGLTIRIGYLGSQVIQGYTEAVVTPAATPTWTTVGQAPAVLIYGLSAGGALASAVASTVAALAAAENNTCPVTAKVTGSGAGFIGLSSYEDALAAGTWNYLSDGVNYVKITTSPGSLAGDYQLTFKNGISSALASGSDWANEDVRLVPLTVLNLTTWLQTLTVTGLSTVCSVAAASQAQNLQIASLTPGSAGAIQIQGGSGNSGAAPVSGSAQLVTDADTSTYAVATVRAADAQGLFAGSWMSVQNTNPVPKSVIQANTTLLSLGSNGVMTFDSSTMTPLWAYSNSGPSLSTTWQIEKQGRYVCYVFNGLYPGASLPDLSGVSEGDWVRITGAATPSANAVAINTVNQGIFRVIRVEAGAGNANARAFWIENPNGSEETSESDVAFFTFNSVMPGDTLSISTSLWNNANKGVWTVESVGAIGGTGPQFVNSGSGQNTMKLSVSNRTPVTVASPGALGSSQYLLVQVSEGVAGKLIKKIRAMAPNQVDGNFVDIKFETSAGYGLISNSAGTVISALDKLGFPLDLTVGVDGYAHNTGLIAEANRVLYGDSQDPATYPGVVAAGASVNTSGPLVKRITCGLSIRARSKVSTVDVANRVRAAVATVINSTKQGVAIPISDIIDAARSVNGVQAVAIITPTFNSTSDLIPVQPYEKPLVLNLQTDVQISFVGQ